MESNVKIGKYTLESLTTGMYNDPKITYREYIQNAVDSLEEAVRLGIVQKEDMNITILVEEENRYISITDNGCGISSSDSYGVLTNVGSSTKRHSMNRGFRGIGRLGGLSYCDKLRFITSVKGENVKTVIEYDCKRLRQLLIPGQYENYNLVQVISEVTSRYEYEEDNNAHYFTVEMQDVDILCGILDIENIKEYLRQTSPIPYKKRFIWNSEIKQILAQRDIELSEFPLYIGTNKEDLEQLFKPNSDKFHANAKEKKQDEISSIEKIEVIRDDKILAIGWYGKCSLYGQITNREIAGIRVRKGNILIGDDRLLNNIFKESRFNGYIQGELFVVSEGLIPNARRDDFEQNEEYLYLIEQLRNGVGQTISIDIRESSKNRNNPLEKKIALANKKVEETKKVETTGFNSSVEKANYIQELEKIRDDVRKQAAKTDKDKQNKQETINKINKAVEQTSKSKNYKLSGLSNLSSKEKKVLKIVTDVLSSYLDKPIVDDIIEEVEKKLKDGGNK